MQKYLFGILLFAISLAFANGITQQQLDFYFRQFIQEYPIVKFSGFFRNIESSQTGLHISNCHNNLCDISYNDYSEFKPDYTPIPECKSSKKLQILDSTYAQIDSAILQIKDNQLRLFGTLTFECEPFIITKNLQSLQAVFHEDSSPTYELVIKNSRFEANFTYPVNLDCLNRDDFSQSQICAKPLLSDGYSFGQFFIFLAREEPESFHTPEKIYTDYKTMQQEIDSCQNVKRHTECIYTALGKFETQIRKNIIIHTTNQNLSYYKLLQH